MKRTRRCSVTGLLLGCAVAAGGAAPSAASTPVSNEAHFLNAGTYSFTVPDGVESITVSAIGAAGGAGGCTMGGAGGDGAAVAATFGVTAGEVLAVDVGAPGASVANQCGTGAGGAGGLGGGGAGGAGTSGGQGGGGGGGASLVGPASPSPAFAQPLIIAGGGGGGGGGAQAQAGSGGAGDQAGAPTAPTGQGGFGGGPGTDTAGGDGGASGQTGFSGGSGTLGIGGTSDDLANSFGGGGGGGGGYYGGGAGGTGTPGGGGGGGASFIAAGGTDVVPSAATTAPASVTITYDAPTADESTTSLTFPGTQPIGVLSPVQTVTLTNNGSAPLIVDSVSVTGANADDYSVHNGCIEHVAVGSSCELGVRFAPQAAGSSSATLTVDSNAATAATPVTLAGTGGSLPQGATGATGAPGKVELITCSIVVRTTKHRRQKARVCSGKVISGTVKFTTAASDTKVTLSRDGVICATGVELRLRAGAWKLIVTPRRKLTRGFYTFTVRRPGGTQRGRVMIR